MSIAGVVFDIGGVVQDSPLHAIARYEREHGIEPGAINRAVVEAGERGAVGAARAGRAHRRGVSARPSRPNAGRAVPLSTPGASWPPSPRRACRGRACSRRSGASAPAPCASVPSRTTGWGDPPDRAAGRPGPQALRDHFDVFVSPPSSAFGSPIRDLRARLRKARPGAARVAFLDDIGRNLKPARELGMATIKVDDPDAALSELGTLLGFALIG